MCFQRLLKSALSLSRNHNINILVQSTALTPEVKFWIVFKMLQVRDMAASRWYYAVYLISKIQFEQSLNSFDNYNLTHRMLWIVPKLLPQKRPKVHLQNTFSASAVQNFLLLL